MWSLKTSNLFVCGLLTVLAAAGCGDEDAPNVVYGSKAADSPAVQDVLPDDPVPQTLGPEGAGSGLCAPADKVYDETLPDSDTTSADLPLTAVQGFTLPAGVGKTETRMVFTSEAAFRAVFGSKPAEIDFTKEWVMFYSPGEAVSSASSVKVVRVRERTGSVRVTTVLGKPSAACVDPPPTLPYVLVRFPSPGWTSCRVSFYHRDDSIACPPPWEPGPTCAGSLTAAGFNRIKTFPTGSTTTRSIYYSRVLQSRTLGRYDIAHFQRTCKTTGCTPWVSYPLAGLLDYYRDGKIYYYQSGSGTSISRTLIAASREWVIDFMSGSTTYPRDCGRWADGESDLSWDGTIGRISRFTLEDQGACRIAHSSAGATFKPISDSYGAVDTLTGTMTDSCVLLKRKVSKSSGASSDRIEQLTTFYTQW